MHVKARHLFPEIQSHDHTLSIAVDSVHASTVSLHITCCLFGKVPSKEQKLEHPNVVLSVKPLLVEHFKELGVISVPRAELDHPSTPKCQMC
eukprot:3258850-Amphidinium_carterae.1